MNRISNKCKLKHNFKPFSAYEIFNILNENNERIRILVKELDNLKFVKNKTLMLLFISFMDNIFLELKILNINKTNREKIQLFI